MIKILSVWSIALGIGAAAAVAQPTIERLAPENSFVIVSVDNFQKSLNRIKRTELWGLWKSDDVAALMEEPMTDFNEELDDVLQELGVEREDLVVPQGSVGFAVFGPGPNDANRTPGFLFMADYGAKAHQMNRIVAALIERAEEEGDVPFREHELLGRTVYTFDISALEIDDPIGFDDDMGIPGIPIPDPGEILEQIKHVHYLRDGRRFFLSSSFNALRNALEVVDEDGRTGLDQREDFRAAVNQLGPVDGYGVLLTRDLARILGGEDGDPMTMMIQGMIQAVVGDIQALSFGVRLDSPDAMVEESFAVYMPNGKAGLTALMDIETPRGELPRFVSPDAIAYSRINFKFDGIIDFIRMLGQVNPMFAMQIDQMMQEMGDDLNQVFSALGPEVHNVATLARPIRLTSMEQLWAIESSRPDQVEQVFARHVGDLGMQPRQILGQTMYSMKADPMMAGMPTYAVGFSGGYVMVGNTNLVEDSLRASARDGGPSLADDPAFQRAERAIGGPRMVGWGYVDLVPYLEYFKDIQGMAQQQMVEQMKQWDPEFAEQMEAEHAAAEKPPWHDFDLDVLRQHIGPLVWELRSVKDGYVGRYLIMAP